MKRHGDAYETFGQLLESIDGCDEELFQLDLTDLQNLWCPVGELTTESDVVPLKIPESNESANISDSDDDNGAGETTEDGSHETFRIHPIPDKIIQQIVADLNEHSAVMLPSRIDCCAHAFNSIGRTDSFDALKSDQLYASRYISVFKKLNVIWNKYSTRLGREIFDSYLNGQKIQKPHRIRWNRIYDAVI